MSGNHVVFGAAIVKHPDVDDENGLQELLDWMLCFLGKVGGT
jgi:hypothetical protein